jgi:hypothetical protein
MIARRLMLTFVIIFSLGQARFALALDCPCTWEHVICEADAVAEVEMHFATKTSPDHMDVRRVFWNRTKDRVRATSGRLYIPNVTRTRQDLLHYYLLERRDLPDGAAMPQWMSLYHRVLKRGSHRSIIFVRDWKNDWYGGGVVYGGLEHWLDHPRHAEWWAKVQPYLQERIEADKRGEKPAFCSRIRREDSRLSM